MELAENLSEEEISIFFWPFVKRKEYTLNLRWSEAWVEERIIPTDRQNLGQVLRDNKLKEYDRYKLLMLGHGRCAQDDYAVTQVYGDELPNWLRERMGNRIEFASAISDSKMVVVFADGEVRVLEAKELGDSLVESVGLQLESAELPTELAVFPAHIRDDTRVAKCGAGIHFGTKIYISAKEMKKKGRPLPIYRDELKSLIKEYVLDTKAVCEELNCSRQYVHQLIESNELTPLKENYKIALYTASDVRKLME